MSNRRILFVDDDEVIRSVMKDLLSDTYETATAVSGEEALEVAETFRPDLVIMDVMMPGISGFETCRRMREREYLKSTKIIMASGDVVTDESLQAGADGSIIKPFDFGEFLDMIESLLGPDFELPAA